MNLSAEFITAVYGKELTNEQLLNSCPDFDDLALTLGEVGCSMSHINVYKRMIDSSIPVALVLEDDVLFNESLITILSSLDNHFFLLNLKPYVFY
ncbi:glycosyltransferase family 25 protein [Xenorhabdus budapestensis]|uniref:glycosyltransferase family 25 protein n=1 Tax=Xenorhabdus budapestensis TaxID=290110 RepID=UPI003A8A67FB